MGTVTETQRALKRMKQGYKFKDWAGNVQDQAGREEESSFPCQRRSLYQTPVDQSPTCSNVGRISPDFPIFLEKQKPGFLM